MHFILTTNFILFLPFLHLILFGVKTLIFTSRLCHCPHKKQTIFAYVAEDIICETPAFDAKAPKNCTTNFYAFTKRPKISVVVAVVVVEVVVGLFVVVVVMVVVIAVNLSPILLLLLLCKNKKK